MRASRFFLLLALVAAGAARAASTFSPDATDLWWNPDESGWGVSFIQQSDTLFATLFVYGGDGRARWYVASNMKSNGAPRDMTMIFNGALYETSGPVLTNAPFNPSAVGIRQVGTITFQYFRPNRGILTYTIDGVGVSKDIRRQTWAATDITGVFNLNRVLLPHRCNGPNTGREPVTNDALGTMTVTQSGSAVQIVTTPPSGAVPSCTYAGTRSQEGHMSGVSGTYTCSDGTSGPFTLSEVEVSKFGFVSRIDTNVRGCNMHGNFGGARATVEEDPS